MSNLEIKLWDHRDTERVERFVKTLKVVFPEGDFSAEYFLWKHTLSPWGPSIVTYAEDPVTGMVAAVRAFWRHRIHYRGRILLAFQPCDTATHPDFRKQGLFTKLTELALEEAQRQKASFVFNFPNPQSKPGYLKMGWHDMGRVITLVKPLNFRRILKHLLINRGKPGSFAPLKKVSGLGQEWDSEAPGELHSRNKRGETAAIHGGRDGEMLYWRFFKHPNNNYELISYDGFSAIVRLGMRGRLRELMIVEPFFRTDKSYSIQLKDLCEFIKTAYCPDIITVLFTKEHSFVESFRENGFYSVPNRINFVAFSLEESLNASGLRWALTACDIDTF